MAAEYTYDYAVVRVVPSVERGEQFNVGIILSCADTDFLDARIELDEQVLRALDPSIDLAARIPHGTGQTYLREILLVLDHTAYHMGELIVARRLLGAWPR